MGDEKEKEETEEKGAVDSTKPMPLEPSGPGLLWVERTVRSGGKEKSASKEELIEVGVFQTEPAVINVEKGLTINMGDFNSARITIGLRLPCYKEEISGAFEHAHRLVEAMLVRETEELKNEDDEEEKDSEKS